MPHGDRVRDEDRGELRRGLGACPRRSVGGPGPSRRRSRGAGATAERRAARRGDEGERRQERQSKRRGIIGDRVSRSVGTRRRGRMAAREPLPEARRADPRDRSRAGHDRGHRARHRFRARLPRLAALPRPAHPVARRHQGLDRVGPPDRRGHHRLRDPRPGHPGRPRPSRSAIDPVAVVRGRRARRLPGLARARDGPPRQQRGVGHRAPRRGARARRRCWSS